ncbi:MAG: copper-binding protein [Deltaproteobacteria bacterium]
MKIISALALVIAIASLGLSYSTYKQIHEMKHAGAHPNPVVHGGASEKFHDATGVVKSVKGSRIVIDEDEIAGFMEAMVMSYDVEKPEQLTNLKEGDKVKFKIRETDVNLTVIDIEKQ